MASTLTYKARIAAERGQTFQVTSFGQQTTENVEWRGRYAVWLPPTHHHSYGRSRGRDYAERWATRAACN